MQLVHLQDAAYHRREYTANEAGNAANPYTEAHGSRPSSEAIAGATDAASHADAGELVALDSAKGAPLAAIAAHGALELLDASGEVRPLEAIEADAIRFAIAHYSGQMSQVARRLHIGRSTLYRKLESLGIDETSDAPPTAL